MDPPPLHLPFSFPLPPPPPPSLHLPSPPPPHPSSSFAPLRILSHPKPVLVPPPSPPNPPPPAAADLPSAISLLQSLTSLARSALLSLASLHPAASSSPSSLACCPFNPHHRMPPESLFRHSLACSSAPPATGASDLLAGLRYPCTLPSNERSQDESDGSAFVRLLGDDPDADLCFSLDDELRELGSNFFYGDCPGVVSAAPEPDASSKTFTLPGFLSVECANFAVRAPDDLDLRESGRVVAPMLPSEYWTLRLEVDALDGSQALFGYTVLRAAAGVDLVQEEGLKGWVICNSQRFGILIDNAVREHIFLLLRLCLKAVGREARSSQKLLLCKDETSIPKCCKFECPNFLKSWTWLASQLAILYGEVNGRLFALEMFKESLRQAGSMLLYNKLGRKNMEESGGTDVANACLSSNGHSDGDSKFTLDLEMEYPPHDISRHKVYVSQVAAAVVALHERSWLEERIRALRYSQPISKYQIILEHSHASARASVERNKRPNYRPILEHDGLIWHRDQNQDPGKTKTREELLAEERDYKRRRMSYRGKKVKRNPSQVLRDIIYEHMEEIKQAGGIGFNVKVSAENKTSHFNHSDSKSSSAFDKPTHANLSESDHSYVTHDLKVHQPKPRNGHYERQEDHDRSRHERHNSRYSSNRNSCLLERSTYQRGQHDMSAEATKYCKRGFSPRSKDCTSHSSLTSRSDKDIHKERTRSYESDRSESVTQRRFDDRYDPSGSNQEYDTYGHTTDSTNQISENEYTYNDDKYYDQQRRQDRSTRRHRKDYE